MINSKLFVEKMSKYEKPEEYRFCFGSWFLVPGSERFEPGTGNQELFLIRFIEDFSGVYLS